ncbi:MAG: hypothetical protein M2R45_04853 [Verrucomicrobia subdivision 3 bacterium]|nr:hypothetical protein [Limisphaerales bacterium]MCS1417540.1 hypothetical protein [Limisphaerales bacterium]
MERNHQIRIGIWIVLAVLLGAMVWLHFQPEDEPPPSSYSPEAIAKEAGSAAHLLRPPLPRKIAETQLSIKKSGSVCCRSFSMTTSILNAPITTT